MAKKLFLSLVVAVLAFFLAKAMGFAGMALAGAGHGSDVLGFLFLSPTYNGKGDGFVCFGPYIWAIVGGLFFWTAKKYVSVCIIIMIWINYIGAAKDIANDINDAGTTSYVFRSVNSFPMFAVLLIATYFVMQLAVYSKIVKSAHSRRTLHNANHPIGAKGV